ncbi:Transcription factor WER [Porphyridium purpureum]|uniref:Transcription factor WER n=1 Tax=Porphyridium purpureum TaxID=35688 RepID=A0A5J4Z5J4_PORPP|nr:Transcription factor WER [Porphyridium purpureum]|eukprot:POR7957..scf295_1
MALAPLFAVAWHARSALLIRAGHLLDQTESDMQRNPQGFASQLPAPWAAQRRSSEGSQFNALQDDQITSLDKMSLAFILNPVPPATPYPAQAPHSAGKPTRWLPPATSVDSAQRKHLHSAPPLTSQSSSGVSDYTAHEQCASSPAKTSVGAGRSMVCEEPDALSGSPVTKPPRRRPWTPDEDELLRQIVQSSQGLSWQRLAEEHIPYRTGQQLRARWVYYVSKPNRPPRTFTPEQDALILELAERHGGWWGMIASELGGAFDDQEVKFRFRKLQRAARRYEREARERAGSDASKLSAPAPTQQTQSAPGERAPPPRTASQILKQQ